jgi:hypothetical protein
MRKMTEREYEQFLEGRKAVGRKINPETAEVTMHEGDFYDPYCCAPEPPSDRDVGQGAYGPNWWVRDPNSDDGWVLFGDMPEATQRSLMKAIPAGMELPLRMDRLLITTQEWLAIQMAEGLKINPETAEVECYYEAKFEHGVYYPRLPEECRGIGREYFARGPGSDIWISFQNLPKAIRKRLRAKLRRDYGREDHKDECSDYLRRGGDVYDFASIAAMLNAAPIFSRYKEGLSERERKECQLRSIAISSTTRSCTNASYCLPSSPNECLTLRRRSA